jgi:glutamine synthetase
MTMAAIDGIQVKLSPGQPVDHDVYHLPPEELAEIRKTPASLGEALTALENDCDFLLKGEVFTPDVIETWIRHKRQNEIDAVRLRPHPYEFCLYYDA